MIKCLNEKIWLPFNYDFKEEMSGLEIAKNTINVMKYKYCI
jgi:hypothetical protein